MSRCVTRAPLSSFDTGPCLRFPRQGQFHPLKYLAGLAEVFQRKGGVIHTNTHASKIDGGSQARVETEAGPVVTAGAVVVGHQHAHQRPRGHPHQAGALSHLCDRRTRPARLGHAGAVLGHAGGYHYIRVQLMERGGDMLSVGGEDHKAGQAEDDQSESAWDSAGGVGRRGAISPMMEPVEYQWSGMVMETTDGLAFIGRNPMDADNIYIATGDSGMGLTHGTIADILLTDLILSRENSWSKIYDPSRKPVWGMAWKEFLVENANVAREYTKDWLGGGDVSSTDEIPRARGRSCGAA